MGKNKNSREEAPEMENDKNSREGTPKIEDTDNLTARLYNNFDSSKENKEEQTYKFLNQPYFSGEESLIDKFIEFNPSITFDCIKDKGINLSILRDSNRESDFRKCLNNIEDNDIKKALVLEIFERIKAEIGDNPPYDDFSIECNPRYFTSGTTSDIIHYFKQIINYLNRKEEEKGAKKAARILRKITIKNKDINGRLPEGKQIPKGIPLKDEQIPTDTKKSFDALLSFEMSKKIGEIIDTANDVSNKVVGLFSNAFPAINTIIGENEEYKFDESKLGPEYEETKEKIDKIEDLDANEKAKRLDILKWEYYIKYLKSVEPQIGNAIKQLYDNYFDYSKLDESVLKDYLDKITDLRLKSFKNSLNETLESTLGDKDFDRFSKFYKELANPSIKEMHLKIDGSDDIDIPIEKTIISKKNRFLMDTKNFGNTASSHDCIPFQYKIKIDTIKNLNIDEEDKTNLINFLSKFKSEEDNDNYIIKGEEVGNLIYLFFVINGKIPKSQMDSGKQKGTEEFFGDNKKGNNKEEKTPEEEKKKEIDEFMNKIEGRGNGNKFEDGSEIWLPIGNSELPGGGYQWMKIKISDIDKEKGTFTGKALGGELQFNKELEGKSKKFSMNEKTLNGIENISKDSGKIRLLPDPNKTDFNSHRNKLNNKLGTGDISFPEGVKRNGLKFTHNIRNKDGKEIEKEAKYFGVPGDDSVSYKIKYNPRNRSFKVSTTYNGTAQKNDGKSENVRYSYSRDMDWNNFLIFFTQKGLIPQTQKQSNNAIKKQEQQMVNGGHRKLNWFTLNNFKNAFKTITGAIKKKIDDYNKSQDEKLQDIIIGDRGLYGKLANILGFIPSMKHGLGELEQEYYNERDNRTRKKIEKYYKDFCADYDFADTFDQEPPYIKIKGKGSLKDQVLNRVKNATDRIKGDPGIYQAAGLLLANIEKGGNAYRGLAGYENQGRRVKALLGKKHYERFLEDKQKCIDSFGTEKNTDKLQDALANAEMTYIINNIYGKDGGLLFGAREKRGLPSDSKNTNYIENPSKRILSEQFAKKLDDLTKDNFTKDSVTNKIPKHNYFDKCEKDFYRFIKSARFSGAMSELEGMISLARTDAQIYTTKKCYLTLMLSGILDFNGNKGLRKFAYTQGKTFGFAPAMLAKKIGHSEEIASLLDDFSGGDFSKHVTAYFHKKDLLNGETDIELLIKQINSWFNEKKMKDFDDYVESIPGKNWEGKSKALQDLQKDLTDYDNQNPDELILKNAKLINSAGLNASADAVDTRLKIDNGDFKGKDQDEKNDIKAFWKSCSEKIDKATKDLEGPGGADRANKMLDKYLGWFGVSGDSKQEIYKRINTAKRYKDKIDSEGKSEPNGKRYRGVVHKKDDENNIPINVPLGKIYDSDVKKILRYGLEGFVRTRRLSAQQLPPELKTALDNFQKFFEEAFYRGYFNNISRDIRSEPDRFLLGGRKTYEKIKQKDNNGLRLEEDNDSISSTDFYGLTDKEKKSLWRRIFNSDVYNYKNDDMSSMRKSLKNHGVSLLDNERGLFNDSSKDLDEVQTGSDS